VAVELFATRGYAGTSIRDITDRLDITKAALYYHFTSKEEILAALIAPFRAEVSSLLAATEGVEVTAAQLIERMVEIVSRRGAVFQALMTDPSVISHAHQSAPREDLRQLARNLAAVGNVPLVNARCALGAIQAGIFGAAGDRRATIDADRARQLVEGHADLLDDDQRAQVVAAAVRALGSPGDG
jgi:TetR/AcrR family transcriptional regulator, regulator of cefoperazone and chloramphenicol sensitivity